jgi:hypothetical protein
VGELDLHALQRPREGHRGLVPIARALGHRPFEHRLERRRDVGAPEGRGRLGLDPLDEVRAAVAASGLLERRPPARSV